MQNQNLNKRITLDFPEDLYRIVKTFAAFYDLSIKDVIVKAVSKELSENNINIPNQETIKTFKKTNKKSGLLKHNSFDALLSDLRKKGEID